MPRNFYSPEVYGFHGCDRQAADALLAGDLFKLSKNAYDWLGHGAYFFESSPEQALEFATQKAQREHRRGRKFEPAVVGVKIQLGSCLELTTQEGLGFVLESYHVLKQLMETRRPGSFAELQNSHEGSRFHFLDEAVIKTLHQRVESENFGFDTIRGTFAIGPPIYDTAAFLTGTHVQICVIKPSCIVERFDPLK